MFLFYVQIHLLHPLDPTHDDTTDASSDCWRHVALGCRHPHQPGSRRRPRTRHPLLSPRHSHLVHPASPPHAPPPPFSTCIQEASHQGPTTSSHTHVHTASRPPMAPGPRPPHCALATLGLTLCRQLPNPSCTGPTKMPPPLCWSPALPTWHPAQAAPLGGWVAICPLPARWGGPTASCS